MPISNPIERYSSAGSRGSGFAFSPATTIAAGTVAILGCGANSPLVSRVLTSVTDSVGNTWSVDTTQYGNTASVSFASAQIVTQITSADTITVNFANPAADWTLIQVEEVSGLSTVSVFDRTAGATGNSNSAATGSTSTLSQGDELVVVYINIPSTTTWTEELGYTRVSSADNNTGGLQYKIVAVSTAVSNTAALGGIKEWGIVLATYRAPFVAAAQNNAPVIYGRGAC